MAGVRCAIRIMCQGGISDGNFIVFPSPCLPHRWELPASWAPRGPDPPVLGERHGEGQWH